MILFYLVELVSAIPNHWIYNSTVGPITVAEWLGLATLLYAMLHFAARPGAAPRFNTRAARLFLLLVAAAFVSCALRRQDILRAGPLVMYAKYLGLFFITVVVVDTVQKLRCSLVALVGAIALAAAYTLREYQKVAVPWYRPGWVAGDSNAFATAALVAIPLAVFLAGSQSPLWQRASCVGCLALVLPAFAITASRGAYLGLSATMLYLLFTVKRKTGFVLLAILLAAFTAYTPSSAISRFRAPRYGDRQSTETHLLLWRAAFRMIETHPVAGIGLGQFKSVVREYAPPGLDAASLAHNIYLEYAAELGIGALLVFLGILVCSWAALERVRRRAIAAGDVFFARAALGMKAGLLGFAIAADFMPAGYLKPFWILVFLATCVPRLYAAHFVGELSAQLRCRNVRTRYPAERLAGRLDADAAADTGGSL